MSKSKKQYTFEDWDNGETLPTQYPEDERVSLFEINKHLPSEEASDIPLALYKLGRMKEEDFKKVRKKQKEAYKILLNYHVKQATQKINSFQNKADQDKYLKQRKIYLEKRIENTRANRLSKLNENLDLTAFTPEICKEILNRDRNGKSQKSYTKISADPSSGSHLNEFRVNETFEIHLLLSEFNKIEEQLNSSEGQLPPSIKNLIKEFSKKFAERASYSQDLIYNYLIHWNEYQGVSYPRASAKKELKKKKISFPDHDNTLKNWEQSWLQFYYSRTTK
ncbi:hypothetical protein SAMN05443144_12913 [Fodinibius roseus]|uniref:Uncharacterized protein n=1 Tax=Fodinibius roseus TaxID=1194090 RepID=A0A1M5K0N0_9BACT|nr:hypothetical protein [Fodinibius roseus]SHG46367.1 hypothetical protein SAMN05443144_12913 [Fodinibius roseus]